MDLDWKAIAEKYKDTKVERVAKNYGKQIAFVGREQYDMLHKDCSTPEVYEDEGIPVFNVLGGIELIVNPLIPDGVVVFAEKPKWPGYVPHIEVFDLRRKWYKRMPRKLKKELKKKGWRYDRN